MGARYLVTILLIGISTAVWAADPPADRQLMLQLLQRLELLEQEVRQLRGRLEVIEHGQQQSARQEQNRYLDTDRRLQALEGGGSSAPARSSTSSAAPAPSAGSATRTFTVADEKTAYEKNFALLREGRIDDSVAGFQAFLVNYPNGEYADNAEYWLGEAYYVSRDFPKAKASFEQLIANYPGSSKIPDARLKLGFTLDELGEDSTAKRVLNDVARDYPGTTVARLAEQRIKQIP
jgi:tol-pal system protein YbgF